MKLKNLTTHLNQFSIQRENRWSSRSLCTHPFCNRSTSSAISTRRATLRELLVARRQFLGWFSNRSHLPIDRDPPNFPVLDKRMWLSASKRQCKKHSVVIIKPNSPQCPVAMWKTVECCPWNDHLRDGHENVTCHQKYHWLESGQSRWCGWLCLCCCDRRKLPENTFSNFQTNSACLVRSNSHLPANRHHPRHSTTARRSVHR